MKINVTYFFRKSNPHFHSIEKLFSNIQAVLPDNVEFQNIYLPFHNGLLGRIKNIFFVKKHSSQINHITGDVNYIALGLPKSNTLLTIHDVGSAFQGNFFKNALIKLFWFNLPFRRVKYISVVSQFTKQELIKLFKIKESKITIIPDSISQRYFEDFVKIENDKPNILFIGTKANKNIENSIKALRGMSVKLIIIGKLNENQKQLLEKNNIDYSNYFNISEDKLLNLYRKSDILLFPSFYEGFGLPIIEAQAVGIPVITSDLEPMRSVAGGVALLVNPNNIEEIKTAIQKIISNEQLRRELTEKGKANSLKYSPQYIAKQYFELYKKMLNEQ